MTPFERFLLHHHKCFLDGDVIPSMVSPGVWWWQCATLVWWNFSKTFFPPLSFKNSPLVKYFQLLPFHLQFPQDFLKIFNQLLCLHFLLQTFIHYDLLNVKTYKLG